MPVPVMLFVLLLCISSVDSILPYGTTCNNPSDYRAYPSLCYALFASEMHLTSTQVAGAIGGDKITLDNVHMAGKDQDNNSYACADQNNVGNARIGPIILATSLTIQTNHAHKLANTTGPPHDHHDLSGHQNRSSSHPTHHSASTSSHAAQPANSNHDSTLKHGGIAELGRCPIPNKRSRGTSPASPSVEKLNQCKKCSDYSAPACPFCSTMQNYFNPPVIPQFLAAAQCTACTWYYPGTTIRNLRRGPEKTQPTTVTWSTSGINFGDDTEFYFPSQPSDYATYFSASKDGTPQFNTYVVDFSDSIHRGFPCSAQFIVHLPAGVNGKFEWNPKATIEIRPPWMKRNVYWVFTPEYTSCVGCQQLEPATTTITLPVHAQGNFLAPWAHWETSSTNAHVKGTVVVNSAKMLFSTIDWRNTEPLAQFCAGQQQVNRTKLLAPPQCQSQCP
eukprot:TRINITY_DN112896_c0_g1_i1.p1 TRINITY_DN112896_c0_g1~~TRINITY_DN112896_c0_g1_i1.p1  ORF type:complete len:447 (+),score=33.30 TRINITY_DN112896_c0_g1_i1:40-1380(+)